MLVIGRGRLIADTTTAEFTQRAADSYLRVASPQAGALAALLERSGGRVIIAGDDALAVSGLPTARIGDLAHDHGMRVHELAPQRASLETAFMELTQDSVEYRPEAVRS